MRTEFTFQLAMRMVRHPGQTGTSFPHLLPCSIAVEGSYDSRQEIALSGMEHPCTLRVAAALAGGLLLAVAFGAEAARADPNSWGMSTQEKQIFDYGPSGSNGSSKAGSVLDSTNPIDLMNKIRKGTAMDDATPPGDAVDAALKALDAQAPVAGAPSSSSQVKAP